MSNTDLTRSEKLLEHLALDGIIARLENFHDNTDRHLADLSAKASQVTQKGSSL